MPLPNESRTGDLVLNEAQYAFIQDLTKGLVNVYVGPNKTSLAQTDQPVKFDGTRFIPCNTVAEATMDFPVAGEGSYLVLQNPAAGPKEHPPTGANQAVPLDWGRAINIRGPARFPLWPGQSVQVVGGHKLRTNQYLVAVVTNGDEATKNWPEAVLLASKTAEARKTNDESNENVPPSPPMSVERMKFVTGQRIVIRGTDASFFIPPTGVEVQLEGKNYVREAVTLESLQYCVLRSESGEKRYVYGPDVVFPEPDEDFIQDGSQRVFKAFVLNPQMGIHVSVVEPYNDDGSAVNDPDQADHRKGDELFITGAQQSIYYPRPEHVIIRYREEQVHYAVVVPAGEGRYVLNKETGNVQLIHGPKMLLCDPRTEVLVLRPLSESEVSLWFPNSTDAARVNKQLRDLEAQSSRYVTEESFAMASRSMAEEGKFVGNEVTRRSAFTEPKSITLDTKYKGAVGINVWPGYAVQVISKTGERKTVVGPANVLLAYDEALAIMELTTGTPKDEHKPKLRTVYLRVTGNRVSDQVQAETMDMVGVVMTVSYRVNFGGTDNSRWFYIEDYVGFLADHLRSVIRNAVKQQGIEEFNRNAVNILRDAVLGMAGEGGTKRKGKLFEENNMHVYDLEVLDVRIGDKTIDALLRGAEQEAVKSALDLENRRRQLNVTREAEGLIRAMAAEKATTALEQMRIQIEAKEKQLELDNAERDVEFADERARLIADKGNQDLHDELEARRLVREKNRAEHNDTIATDRQALELALIEAKTRSDAERFKAMGPEFVAAINAMGDKELMAKVATALRTIPMGMNEGMGDVMARLFTGTVLENTLKTSVANGSSPDVPTAIRR